MMNMVHYSCKTLLAAVLLMITVSGDDSLDLASYLLDSSRYNPALIPSNSQPVTVKLDLALKTIVELVGVFNSQLAGHLNFELFKGDPLLVNRGNAKNACLGTFI